MITLLYIKASPRGDDSSSGAVAESYLANLRAKHPDLAVEVIDLWKEALPEFDGNKANAKLAVVTRQTHTAAQKTAWDEITAIAKRFARADQYLFSVPMWNGGIPYRLKQYIDIIHQPGLLFGMNPETGYFGLLTGKKATLIYTSGVYAPGATPAFGSDHHSTYMRAWLNQAGITDIKEVRYQPTLLTPDPQAGLEDARAMAELLAV